MICKDIEHLKDFIYQFELVNEETIKKATYYGDSHQLHMKALQICTLHASEAKRDEFIEISSELDQDMLDMKSSSIEVGFF